MSELEIAAGTEAVLIAGPTASGKSRLALELGATSRRNRHQRRLHAGLSATSGSSALVHRPRTKRLRHTGFTAMSPPASAIRSAAGWSMWPGFSRKQGRHALVPVFVGGTGLYFKALTEGLATVPPIPPPVREYWRVARRRGSGRSAARGVGGTRRGGRRRHPAVGQGAHRQGARSDRGHRQVAGELASPGRVPIRRSWRSPGRPAWYSILSAPCSMNGLRCGPSRWSPPAFSTRCRRLGRLRLDRATPAMKAIGVREFLDHLAGKRSLEEAVTAVKTETRRYAKRQSTWFRNQVPDWRRQSA